MARSSSLGTKFANQCLFSFSKFEREHPNFLVNIFIDDLNECSCISCSKLSLESVLVVFFGNAHITFRESRDLKDLKSSALDRPIASL